MPPIEYRRAQPEDYPAILALQAANFIANLTAEERQQGFLSAQFTPEQTARIAEDLGTMGAVVDNIVGGFLCACRKEFDTGSPVIATMLASYDRLTFQGKPLSSFSSYIRSEERVSRDAGAGVV